MKEKIRKAFKWGDRFGDKFSFKYNSYDKYSTVLGGVFSFIFLITSIVIFSYNLGPFLHWENYSLQFYK